MRAAAPSLLLLAVACSDVPPFYCDDDPQCRSGEVTGVCTFYGLCAFPDAACPDFELRYDDSAGELAGVCVGDEGFDADCPSDFVEMPTAPECAAFTEGCLEPCETDQCFENCLEDDPDPDACGECLDEAYVACGNEMGCQLEWDALVCCFDQCDNPESPACESGCAVEIDTYESCVDPFDEACSDAAAICFRP